MVGVEDLNTCSNQAVPHNFYSFYDMLTRSMVFMFVSVPSVAPEHVRCAPLTSQSLQISWQPPAVHHTNGLLQGYKINFEYISDTVATSNDEIDSRKSTELTIVLTGLRKFTNYSVQVLAFTRIGDGILSSPIYCKTEEDGMSIRTLKCIFSITIIIK